jgi:hypothetical protein
LLAAALVIRIIPDLWSSGKHKAAVCVAVMGFPISFSFMLAEPLSIHEILLMVVAPVILGFALLAWYASVERKWDKEDHQEYRKQLQDIASA